MRLLFKLAILAFVAYAIVTAPPSDKLAMVNGVRAVASAFEDACTRPESPCTASVEFVRRLTGIGDYRNGPYGESRGALASYTTQFALAVGFCGKNVWWAVALVRVRSRSAHTCDCQSRCRHIHSPRPPTRSSVYTSPSFALILRWPEQMKQGS